MVASVVACMQRCVQCHVVAGFFSFRKVRAADRRARAVACAGAWREPVFHPCCVFETVERLRVNNIEAREPRDRRSAAATEGGVEVMGTVVLVEAPEAVRAPARRRGALRVRAVRGKTLRRTRLR
jgi:hypothetical protein